jgi:hypothetical protein
MKTPTTKKSIPLRLIALAVIVSSLTLVTWMATGRHSYTKFEVVERVEVPVDASDPLAGTGFYDDASTQTTVKRDEFHLGLLPTPQGLLDKHALSVVSILAPTWGVCLPLIWWLSRRRRVEG